MRHRWEPERVTSGCRILPTHTVLFRPRHPLLVGDGAVRRHVSVRTPNGRAPRGTAAGMSGGRTATALIASPRPCASGNEWNTHAETGDVGSAIGVVGP